ncbi:MAG: HYR domain-containing protein, partial [Ilumatobacter sp.]
MRTHRLLLSTTLAPATFALGAAPATPVAAITPDVTQFDITPPPGSGDEFGINVTVLSNGNYVIDDKEFSTPTVDEVGAVYLYDGRTDELISTLTGAQEGDRVGRHGVDDLGNGFFVVSSGDWNHPDGTERIGAVTVVNAATGLDGLVTLDNSLHGTQEFDRVGNRGVEVLEGAARHFVVMSDEWNHPDGTLRVGAVTWVDGTDVLTGPVTVDNSLHGTSADDEVSRAGVTPLISGGYVVKSDEWNHPDGTTTVGAVTVAAADGSTAGPVTVDNSLHGTAANDFVGRSVRELDNGNLVVLSSTWNLPGGPFDVGAATWMDPDDPIVGPVTVDNSLHGTTAGDAVGQLSRSLRNGNYLVRSRNWNHPDGTRNVGALTWGDGTTGISGPVTTTNSLHGTTANDRVGASPRALENGNYVATSATWDHPDGTIDVGAVTWGDGTTGISGPVTTANSLHGTTANDSVGRSVLELDNGNYVALSPSWDLPDGTADVGAATWADGSTGITGPVTTANSLHGTTADDQVGGFIGRAWLAALTNGNYVVRAPFWDHPDGTVDVGAAVWVDGTTGVTGPITVDNALHGTTTGDRIGDDAEALSDGNYVVGSDEWDLPDGTANVGAATFGDGSTGITGPVTVANSQHGQTADDGIGGQLLSLDEPAGASVSTSSSWTDPDTGVIGAETVIFAAPGDASIGPVDRSNVAVTPPEIDDVLDELTASDGIVITTDGGGIVIMRLDLEPFFDVDVDDIVAVTAPGDDTAVVEFAAPVASDLRSTPTVDCAPASGTVFPVGDTEVTCTASDSAGQTATTSFAVTVTATEADPDPNPGVPADVTAVTPERILETRAGESTVDGLFEGAGTLAAGKEVELQVAGRGGVPADATAVFLNVTAIRPDARGFLTIYPCTDDRPNTSNVNYAAGGIAPNAVLAKLSAAGTVCVFSSATAHLIVDTAGFTPASSTVEAVTPERILETRPGQTSIDGLFEGAGTLGAGDEI